MKEACCYGLVLLDPCTRTWGIAVQGKAHAFLHGVSQKQAQIIPHLTTYGHIVFITRNHNSSCALVQMSNFGVKSVRRKTTVDRFENNLAHHCCSLTERFQQCSATFLFRTGPSDITTGNPKRQQTHCYSDCFCTDLHYETSSVFFSLPHHLDFN